MLVYGKYECFGSMSVSSCICFMFVTCVHPVAVLNAAFGMTCSFLLLIEDASGDHMEEAYSRAGLMTVQAKTLCTYGCMYFLTALVLVCVDVMAMS